MPANPRTNAAVHVVCLCPEIPNSLSLFPNQISISISIKTRYSINTEQGQAKKIKFSRSSWRPTEPPNDCSLYEQKLGLCKAQAKTTLAAQHAPLAHS